MTNPAGSFIWYELMTPDPDAAKTFYDVVVGWSIEGKPAGEMDYRMIRRTDGGNAGGILGLSVEMIAGGAQPSWVGYLCDPDVDARAAAIVAAGGALTIAPHDMPGVGRFAMLRDPQGAAFYLMDPVPPPGSEAAASDVFSVDQPQHVRWNELLSSDPDASADFYTRHFGWTQQGEMDMGPAGKYLFIQHDGVGIGAIMGLAPQQTASAWQFYIGVDDIDRATGAVNAGGGTIRNGPHQIPGGEYSASGIDPQGACFGIVGPRSN